MLICGELDEWETNIYAADAAWLGFSKAVITVGHADSEEPGMAVLAEWLGKLFPDTPVHHLPMGDPFVYV